MLTIELEEFDATLTAHGCILIVKLCDWHNQVVDNDTIATYELSVEENFNYTITSKHYHEQLTIKQTKDCDDYLEKIYQRNIFEDEIVRAFDGGYDPFDEIEWFI